jgi:hypothetical protein
MIRDDALTAIRPVLTLAENNSPEPEAFQNEVIRPILELQHDAIVLVVEAARDRFDADTDLQEVFDNTNLQDQLIGMTMGMLTEDELLYFLADQDNLQPLVVSMIRKTIEDLFESTASGSS